MLDYHVPFGYLFSTKLQMAMNQADTMPGTVQIIQQIGPVVDSLLNHGFKQLLCHLYIHDGMVGGGR
ncbi:hypothetical protein CEXT_11611 [Caerostris extrusa]|uniref:Uncharacterized protein n=1 Tax=Caerostris extrusa TaxID=172846 RepID=A0AAV4XE02_CAEEX|nr:hypothetical protein CEXT_11611 [Caerostris extrusa]